MNRVARLAFAALLVAVVAGAVVWRVQRSRADAPSAVSMAGPVQPKVDGNRLVDARNDRTWIPHGVNWSSFEYACAQGWGYSTIESATQGRRIAAAMASWHVDTVRLPLNQDCWLGTRGAPASEPGKSLTVTGYRAAVAQFVHALHAQKIVVILDLQSRKRETENQFGNVAMPDAGSLDFWRSVATAYAHDRSVMFDAFNEPYSRYDSLNNRYAFQLSWACWRDGGCDAPVEDDKTAQLSGRTYPVQGMAAVVQTIRQAGAHQPIMLGGLDYANDLSQWLAHRPDDGQLVASFHSYNFAKCHDVTCWNDTIAPVARTVPVLTGEVGEDDHSASYLSSYMTWADAHGIGYLAWTWLVKTDDPMSLIVDQSGTPTTPYGTTFRTHLLSLASGSSHTS